VEAFVASWPESIDGQHCEPQLFKRTLYSLLDDVRNVYQKAGHSPSGNDRRQSCSNPSDCRFGGPHPVDSLGLGYCFGL